jgi:hypothetical protein
MRPYSQFCVYLMQAGSDIRRENKIEKYFGLEYPGRKNVRAQEIRLLQNKRAARKTT